VPQSRPTCHR